MKKEIAIILSVYNGEKYIREQIESLLNQSQQNVQIYIHDDGSEDNSPHILSDYETKYNNIHVISGDHGLGYPMCFISLLEIVDGYKYYAFCDQDDLWLPNKVRNGVNVLESKDNSMPLLYYTAVEYCDSQLNHIRNSRFASGKRKVEKMNLQSMLFGGEAMGMTFVFNNKAREALVLANKVDVGAFKDWFLKLYCATCGSVYYDPKPSAKYRRHGAAVTNNSNPAKIIDRYIGQIKEVFFSKNGFENQKTIINYINKYCKNIVNNESVSLIDLFSEPNTISKRIKKFLWPKRFRTRLIDEMGYRLAFLIGRI